jgi:hypothetical protein
MLTRLSVTSLINIHNKDEIPEIKAYFWDKVLYACNTPLYEGSGIKNWKFLTGVDRPPFPKEFFEIKERYNEGPKQFAKRSIGGCAVLLNGIELTSAGKAMLCAGGRSVELGNLNESSLEELWHAKREFLARYDLTGITCLPREKPELYAKLKRS